ncbi:hypothetical protein GCM10027190_30960 [Spirosoma areae]
MTIEATYENGHIIWQEQPPVQTKRKVLVTFLEETKEQSTSHPGNVIRFGSLKGQIDIGSDFNDPLDDLKEYM